MGTRADFYVGRGRNAEWLGSIAWDGYPGGLPDDLLRLTSEGVYREHLARFFRTRDDATHPDDGWPWPWEDSRTTDYAYAFEAGRVWGSCFGREWFPADEPEPEDDRPKTAEFPDMTDRQRVAEAGTDRSGLIAIRTRPKETP